MNLKEKEAALQMYEVSQSQVEKLDRVLRDERVNNPQARALREETDAVRLSSALYLTRLHSFL